MLRNGAAGPRPFCEFRHQYHIFPPHSKIKLGHYPYTLVLFGIPVVAVRVQAEEAADQVQFLVGVLGAAVALQKDYRIVEEFLGDGGG